MDQLKQMAARRTGATGAGRRIYTLLRTQIADGTLAAGAPAPSTRALAAELGVSRTTVTAVYEQLAAEGFLVTSPGRAAQVAGHPPASDVSDPGPAPGPACMPSLSRFGRRLATTGTAPPDDALPPRYDFRYGALASRDFPTLAWRRAYQLELLRQQSSLCYASPEGDQRLRRALQGYLGRARGLCCDAEQILVVNGSQQAIDLCARLLLDAGDAFVFEDPGYLNARRCFEATGADCVAVPADSAGLDTGALPESGRLRLAYVTPSHQFPLGGVLPIGRRLALLQWAKRHDAWIVEDDYDGEFRYGQRPIDALQSVDADARVIYVGTFSKALSPQLRLGYMVVPAALVAVFRQAKRLSDRHAPLLDQRVLASLIEDGVYERHVRSMRRKNEQRRIALLDAIASRLPKDVEISGSAAGLHIVLWLPLLTSADETAIAAACRASGVGLYPVSPLFAATAASGNRRRAGFILGYASLSAEDIDKGIAILASVLGHW